MNNYESETFDKYAQNERASIQIVELQEEISHLKTKLKRIKSIINDNPTPIITTSGVIYNSQKLNQILKIIEE